MQDNIASRMLTALAADELAPEVAKESTPTEEQKRYIKRYVDSLSRADKKSVGDIIIMNDKLSSLVWCSEGTAINLDTLPAIVVDQIYEFVLYKIGI